MLLQGFCAVNVLIFDDELREAEQLVRLLAAAGVDALIVQVSRDIAGAL